MITAGPDAHFFFKVAGSVFTVQQMTLIFRVPLEYIYLKSIFNILCVNIHLLVKRGQSKGQLPCQSRRGGGR